ncbi:DUF6650 family protein [Priestia aryabhattai]
MLEILRKIRITGFSTSFFGVSWEYNDKENKEDEKDEKEKHAVSMILVLLESKRLIMMPHSRHGGIPFHKDIQYCSHSALDIKDKLVGIMFTETLSPEIKSIVQNMVSSCNNLLDNLISIESSIEKSDEDINSNRECFLQVVDSFKRELFTEVELLLNHYDLPFTYTHSSKKEVKRD